MTTTIISDYRSSLIGGLFAARYIALILLLPIGETFILQYAHAEPPISLPSIIERGPNSRVWQRTSVETLPNGRVRNRTSGYTELATGLHYIDQQGQWQESQEIVELFQDGAVARQGPIQVIWAPNLATPGAIDLMTPDGKRLRTHVLGLAIHDMATGNSELIAEVKDCLGELHPPNQVLYPDAFTDVKATVRYTYNRDRFEQDVILFERLTLPAGYNPASTRLEIWTEAIAPPTPGKTVRQVGNLTDEILDFGATQMGAGRAFLLEDPQGRGWSVPMVKEWSTTVEGRTFLIESIEYIAMQAQLNLLPLPKQGAAIGNPPPIGPRRQMAINATGRRYFPARQQTAKVGGKVKVVQTAAVKASPLQGEALANGQSASTKGLVLDYSLAVTSSNVTFKGDSTYYISGPVNLTGTTTFEGGTVIKYAPTNNACIEIAVTGSMVCKTAAYRPAVFTARDDPAVGDIIGTNVLSGYYATSALKLHDAGHTLSHIRISYAREAINIDDGQLTTRHAQFTYCATAFVTTPVSGIVVKPENSLFYMVSCVATGGQIYFYGQNITVDQANKFASHSSSNIHVFLTNSLLVSLTNWGAAYFTTNYTVQASDPATVFQTVGAAGHYLLDDTYRNLGTTGIDPTLLSELQSCTTYPPVVIQPSAIYTNSIVLSPQAQRDADGPDLGYHYDPLDYAMAVVALQDATITILPGTAVALFSTPPYNYGIALLGGASLISEGSAAGRNRLVRYNTVQEQANTNWISLVNLNVLTDGWTVSPTPQARFRFTDWSVLSGGPFHFEADVGNDNTYSFTDCEFHGGNVKSLRPNMAFTNCLFNRVAASFEDNVGDYSTTTHVHDSTFHGGQLWVSHYNAALWAFTDNLFDDTTFFQDGDVTNAYNAYTTNLVASRLTPIIGTNDVMLAVSNFAFQTWGANTFHIPTNSPLIDKGSTWATNVGLYYFTAITNQTKEAASKVDIGYHYVAVTNGVPIDTDGDGLQDYFEDANGNGSLDRGETSPLNASDVGLKVLIIKPRRDSLLP